MGRIYSVSRIPIFPLFWSSRPWGWEWKITPDTILQWSEQYWAGLSQCTVSDNKNNWSLIIIRKTSKYSYQSDASIRVQFSWSQIISGEYSTTSLVSVNGVWRTHSRSSGQCGWKASGEHKSSSDTLWLTISASSDKWDKKYQKKKLRTSRYVKSPRILSGEEYFEWKWHQWPSWTYTLLIPAIGNVLAPVHVPPIGLYSFTVNAQGDSLYQWLSLAECLLA